MASRSQTRVVETALRKAKQSIITVDAGRGFVIGCRNHYGCTDSLVVTAAHCLPSLPRPHAGGELSERTYADLLGPIGTNPTVSAECLFADLIADVAVLGCPDDQALISQAGDYKAFIKNYVALRIVTPILGESHAWVMSLGGEWLPRQIEYMGGLLQMDCPVTPGMSGSPIVNDRGAAIGLLSNGGFDPELTGSLPGRFLPRPAFQRRVEEHFKAL
jgi:hypothetical protein